MSTLGIGVDIVENSRIRKSINNKKFLLRIFTKNEIAQSLKTKSKVAFFSKRFAAKEAFSKALGFGFRKCLNFKVISIINNKYGKPSIKIKDKLQNIIKKQFKTNKVNILLSISDENKYSIAFVILENNEIK